MKKILILLASISVFAVGCSDDTKEINLEPKSDEKAIESAQFDYDLNEISIANFQEKLDEFKDSSDTHQTLIDSYQSELDKLLSRREDYQAKLDAANNTQIYSDTFSIVEGVGFFEVVQESVLSEKNHVTGFSRNMIKETLNYIDLIQNGAVYTSVVEVGSDGTKHHVITAYYSQSDLERTDFEELLDSENKDLYTESTAVQSYFMSDDLITSKSAASLSDVPELYYEVLGLEYRYN